jgi:triacylglycerol lipase
VTRNRRLLRAWAVGLVPLLVLAAIVAGVLVRRSVGRSGLADPAPDRPGTVLLVSGYGGGTGGLDSLARQLRAQGRRVRVVPPAGDNTGDLRGQAEAIDRAARAAIAGGAPSVDVVAHSAGGVAARIWVADLGGGSLARRVVTLGSPHHGTQLAALGAGLFGGCSTACRQLVPGSDLLRGLPEAPRGPVWVSIWTADDQTVVPPDSARLAGAVNIEVQAVCPGERVSHGGLLTDPAATGLVERAVGAGLERAPPASRCAALKNSGAHVP